MSHATILGALLLTGLVGACGDGAGSQAMAPDMDSGAADTGTDRDAGADLAEDITQDPTADADTSENDAEPDVVEDVADEADMNGDAPDVEPGDLTITFPQALGGAVFANPDLYPSIPVRVVTTGDPDDVLIGIRGGMAQAASENPPGVWTAHIAIDRLGQGRIDLVGTATRGDVEVEGVLELHVGDEGVRITDYEEVGSGLTPTLHQGEDGPVLTWTDRSDGGAARAWLQPLDGAGRLVETRIQLTPDEHQAIYARTALGDGVVCVLYQRLDGDTPYVNEFRVVDAQGAELQSSVPLNPSDRFGSYGGAIAWDGTGCVMTYRVNNGPEEGELYWRRWDKEAGLGFAVQVAAAGNNDPHGGFNANSDLNIAATSEHSVVTFVRQLWNPSLDTRVDRAQFRIMAPDGSFVHRGFIGRERSFHWHTEIQVARVGGSLVPIWAEQDLLDPEPNPTTLLHAGILDPNEPPQGGLTGQVLVDAPLNRGEPVLIERPGHFGVLAWTDERSYADPLSGAIQLHFEPVDNILGRLTGGEESIIRHARFIAGTAHIRGREHGGNILLVWTDERHGGGIFDPRPEIYFETLWY